MSDDQFERGTQLLREWYWSEIRSLADAGIEASAGRLVTQLPLEDLALIPRSLWASARESFVPYRVAEAPHTYSDGRMATRDDGSPIITRYRERDSGQDPRDFLTEWVDQTTDGHQFVIYTFQAQAVLLVSESDGAYEEETGGKPPSPEVAACYAMRRDVWEMLDARHDEWSPEV